MPIRGRTKKRNSLSNIPETVVTTKRARGRPRKRTALPRSSSFESEGNREPTDQLPTAEVDKIKNKVDDFFRKVEKRDDLFQELPITEEKVHVYTIDDDDDHDDMLRSINNYKDKPSTSGASATVSAAKATKGEHNSEDLFSYIDSISDEVEILTPEPEINSLEELKKKTGEIVGEVTSMFEESDLFKKINTKGNKSPDREKPSCPICMEEYTDDRKPMCTVCGHIFCNPCITTVIKTLKKCPTCKKTVTMKKIHPVYL